MRLLLAALALSSCASLRTDWARIDYLTGRPTDVMVCSFALVPSADGELETVGKCADFDAMQEGLAAAGYQHKLKAARP